MLRLLKKAVQEVATVQKARNYGGLKTFVAAILVFFLLFIPLYLLFYDEGGDWGKQLKRLLPVQISAEQQVPAPSVTD